MIWHGPDLAFGASESRRRAADSVLSTFILSFELVALPDGAPMACQRRIQPLGAAYLNVFGKTLPRNVNRRTTTAIGGVG
jgi:hypothetical protein